MAPTQRVCLKIGPRNLIDAKKAQGDQIRARNARADIIRRGFNGSDFITVAGFFIDSAENGFFQKQELILGLQRRSKRNSSSGKMLALVTNPWGSFSVVSEPMFCK